MLAERSIEVAHPAGAQSLLGSSQAEVFCGDGDVYVAMCLSVGAHPYFIVKHRGDDVEGCRSKPLSVVATLQ